MSKVYIILLNWNGEVDTCNCVESILSSTHKHFDILICDNQSEKKSVDYIESFCKRLYAEGRIGNFNNLQNTEFTQKADINSPQISLIHTGGNLGFAGGVNVGLKYAMSQKDSEYYWILNNDCIVTTDALGALLQRMKSDQAVGICGSTLIYEHDRKTVQALGGAAYNKFSGASRAIGAFEKIENISMSDEQVEARMSYIIGASMLVSGTFIKKVGLMDESYFLYSEEQDWAHRALSRGFKLAYARHSVVYHKHGASIGSNAYGGSPKSMFYLYRSKVIYTKKFHLLCLSTVVLHCLYLAFKFLLKGHADKSLAMVKGVFSGIK